MKFEGTFKDHKSQIKIGLKLLSYKEGELFVIYSPDLDVFGYGDNEEESKKSFACTLEEFLRYTTNKGTFLNVLKNLGWRIVETKKTTNFYTPDLSKQLKTNEHLKEIYQEKDYHSFKQDILIPEMA